MHRFAVCCITLSAKPVISSAKLSVCLFGAFDSLSCHALSLKKNNSSQQSIALGDDL
jgi:hypothetical protein